MNDNFENSNGAYVRPCTHYYDPTRARAPEEFGLSNTPVVCLYPLKTASKSLKWPPNEAWGHLGRQSG